MKGSGNVMIPVEPNPARYDFHSLRDVLRLEGAPYFQANRVSEASHMTDGIYDRPYSEHPDLRLEGRGYKYCSNSEMIYST